MGAGNDPHAGAVRCKSLAMVTAGLMVELMPPVIELSKEPLVFLAIGRQVWGTSAPALPLALILYNETDRVGSCLVS